MDGGYEVYYKRSTLILSAFCCVFCAAFLIVGLAAGEGFLGAGLFWALIAVFLAGAYMLLVCLRWRIRVDGNALRVTPVFGRTKAAQLSEITDVTIKAGLVTARAHGKKLLTVDASCVNAERLVKALKNRGSADASGHLPDGGDT